MGLALRGAGGGGRWIGGDGEKKARVLGCP